jgi:hypothetical protein
MLRLYTCLLILALTACTKTTTPPDAGGEGGGQSGAGGGSSAGGPGGGGGEGGAGGGMRPRIEFVDRQSGTPDLSSLVPTTAVVMRQFTCDDAVAAGSMPVADVAGAAGEQLVIKPAGSPCSFHLVHRAGTAESPLSSQPAGYLIASARLSGGVRVACASEEQHHAVAGTPNLFETDSVQARCWASSTTAFSASTVAVTAEADWAAWVKDVSPHATRVGAWTLTWVRDSTFQFGTMTDHGRPATDGVYETVLVWDGTALTAETAVKVSSVTNPFAGAPVTRWEPTPQDVSDLGGFIDFRGLGDAGP